MTFFYGGVCVCVYVCVCMCVCVHLYYTTSHVKNLPFLAISGKSNVLFYLLSLLLSDPKQETRIYGKGNYF